MITCQELIEFLMDYVNGDLPSDERTAVDSHLVVCPECVTFLHTYQLTIREGHQAFAECDQSEAPAIPESLVQAILAARAKQQP